MVTEACVNTEEVTENMEDTEITDTNRIMVEVMAMDIPLMEATVMEEDINRMAKDTEVDMEVTVTTNSEAMVGMEVTDSEAMVVTAAISLEAMAVTVATNSEVMEATEVVMATLIPIIPQTKMNTSQKFEFLKSFFNHVFYSVISNIHIRRLGLSVHAIRQPTDAAHPQAHPAELEASS